MGPAADILRSPSFWLGFLILVALLVLGYAGFLWARRWSLELRSPEEPGPDMVEHYRQLRDQGDLSEEEFERICGLVAEDQRKKEKGERKTEKGEGAAD